ncbi:MAG: hypothetical protein AAF542_26095, partial [Pseudomonadota bacterium]
AGSIAIEQALPAVVAEIMAGTPVTVDETTATLILYRVHRLREPSTAVSTVALEEKTSSLRSRDALLLG